MKSTGYIVHAVGLRKTYRRNFWQKETVALAQLDLAIERGTVFGLLGPNGSGKSTFFKILAGLIRPSIGHVWLFDRTAGDPIINTRLGYLPDRAASYDYLTAEESLRLSGRLGELRGKALQQRVDELFELVGLQQVRSVRLREYSKGMLQRIGIAQAIVHDPELLVFDEPMSGLDPVGRRDVRRLIVELKFQGKTILFSSHLLEDVNALCDRVGALVNGRLEMDETVLETIGRLSPKGDSDEKCSAFSVWPESLTYPHGK